MNSTMVWGQVRPSEHVRRWTWLQFAKKKHQRDWGLRMMLDQLRTARRKSVGTKQTLKAVQKGIARQVFVAKDAEPHVVSPLLTLCQENDTPYTYADNMKVLGRACGIQVGAAAAAIID
ncbi:MAG: ribosomal L7Ae/L30e/S12e/Gadd45 family protein [bacterium]|jgi:large subunit ribosomal protein L7A